MSDDFGTINARRGDRTREIDVLRQHYLHHRHALTGLVADAPSEHLATEYQRLIADLDVSLRKLDELEGRGAAGVAAVQPPQHEPLQAHGDPLRSVAPDAGSRPLINSPAVEYDGEYGAGTAHLPMGAEEPRSRVAWIVVAALVALALIGWLIWRASSDVPAERPLVEETTAPATGVADTADTIAPAAPMEASELSVTPPQHDYGTIRKGTRATRQYEISNNSEEPITIQVARSACRCLYYEHAPVIPPKARETLTVTIDGARAAAGELRETVAITSKSGGAARTSIDVIATIR